MLVNILSNHPSLHVYPDDSKFFQLTFPLFKNSTADQIKKVLLEKNFQYTLNVLKKAAHKVDDSLFESAATSALAMIDGDDWVTGLSALENFSYLIAAGLSGNYDNNIQRIFVEKTTSSEFFCFEIRKRFPEARFLHVIRDLRGVYSSLKSGFESKYKYLSDTPTYEHLLHSIAWRAVNGLRKGLVNKTEFREDYKFVKFEDLVLSREDELLEISDFLGINFREFYDLEPKIFGNDWCGNSFIQENNNGLFEETWAKTLTARELDLLDFLAGDVMREFGYDWEKRSIDGHFVEEYYSTINFYSTQLSDFSTAGL